MLDTNLQSSLAVWIVRGVASAHREAQSPHLNVLQRRARRGARDLPPLARLATSSDHWFATATWLYIPKNPDTPPPPALPNVTSKYRFHNTHGARFGR